MVYLHKVVSIITFKFTQNMYGKIKKNPYHCKIFFLLLHIICVIQLR